MPYIRQRTYKQNKDNKEYSYKKSKEWAEFYGSRAWSRLRDWKIRESPLCEVCLGLGKSTPAEHVHHLHVFRDAPTKEGKWDLFLDPANLASLCSEHHHAIHNYLNNHGLTYASIDNLIHDIEQNNST